MFVKHRVWREFACGAVLGCVLAVLKIQRENGVLTRMQLNVLISICVERHFIHFIQYWWICEIGLQKAAICHFDRPAERINFVSFSNPISVFVCRYAGSHTVVRSDACVYTGMHVCEFVHLRRCTAEQQRLFLHYKKGWPHEQALTCLSFPLNVNSPCSHIYDDKFELHTGGSGQVLCRAKVET